MDELKTRLEQLLSSFNADSQVAEELKAAARELVLEAKSEALSIKQQAEARLEDVSGKEEQLSVVIKRSEEKEKQLVEIYEKEAAALEKIDGLSKKEAEEKLLNVIDKELAEEYARRIRENEDKIKAESDRRARGILVSAMQRVGTENVGEYTTYSVDLPDEDIKGRIIGKDGRNIKAFEEHSGVSVEIGEPGEPVVTVSSFDPVRREIAKRAMEKLVADGRIQPTRIEEAIKASKEEVDAVIREAGEDLLYRAGLTGFAQEIVDLLGRLKFRSSYGQNMIEHTLEVIKLGAAIATEVGANVEVVKRACLLHDIGKAVTAETDQGHAEVGAEICRRYGVAEDVVVAFEGHHTDVLPTPEAVIMYLADAISGARPGARKEDYEGYVNRVKELEEIADAFAGVQKSYAIAAGKEVRVLVNPAEISDAEMFKLAHDIAHEIHERITNFPAPIKVNVVRETRASAVAKPG
ncbi:ribonuclease Y [candidate division WWE3 bacterium]|uniref:Ribonuclease Y n=1 Tax=candidate division WWE3 bacterium TaxID=2053526 RepID=A0A955RRK8_UNCKA|nr:ribonuclease Y [candidate division WWE3 bacterium]